LLAPALFSFGCMGSSSAVRVFAPGDVSQLRSQAAIPAVYFVPFDLSNVVLKGDHGDPSKATENEHKWFSHVVAGAQVALDEAKTGTVAVFVTQAPNLYDREVMDKLKVRFRYSQAAPDDAIVVTGRYLISDNVSGGSRAMLGVLIGKT